MLNTIKRLAIASVLGLAVALSLIIFMRFLIGGSNPEDNYFTRIFRLDTVVLPTERTRPSKPPAVLEQPDTDDFLAEDIKAESEEFLYSQKLEKPDEIATPVIVKPELVQPNVEATEQETKSELSSAREELISILEADEE